MISAPPRERVKSCEKKCLKLMDRLEIQALTTRLKRELRHEGKLHPCSNLHLYSWTSGDQMNEIMETSWTVVPHKVCLWGTTAQLTRSWYGSYICSRCTHPAQHFINYTVLNFVFLYKFTPFSFIMSWRPKLFCAGLKAYFCYVDHHWDVGVKMIIDL